MKSRFAGFALLKLYNPQTIRLNYDRFHAEEARSNGLAMRPDVTQLFLDVSTTKTPRFVNDNAPAAAPPQLTNHPTRFPLHTTPGEPSA